jgi:DNA helicase-2/ATP-dependent DNA helicase PcrA
MHGSWNSTIPSRFLDELPEKHVTVTDSKGGFAGMGGYGNYGGAGSYGPSRFDSFTPAASSYSTPGWQRAQRRKARGEFDEDEAAFEDAPPARNFWAEDDTGTTPRPGAHAARGTGTSKGRFAARREPLTIEGELVAKSTGPSAYAPGDRVFHIKFGNGNVTAVDGNKLTILFDKAGEKRVVDSFVERV